jgi:RNA polymerase sigma-70 factor (ECF subfamily)
VNVSDDLRDPTAAPHAVPAIVATTCLRVWRRRAARGVRALADRAAEAPNAGDSSPGMPAATEELDGPPLHGTRAPTAVANLTDRQEVMALLRNLEVLPAKQRAALVLRYGHDLPVPEVAALLGVELATAKTHLVRGLARLRDLMEEHR